VFGGRNEAKMSVADWIAVAAALISLIIAVAAIISARAAKMQTSEAKRASDAAEDSAATVRRAIQSLVDFTPVLMIGSAISGTEHPLIEIRWKGPQVTLESVVATKWLAIDKQGNTIPGQISGSDVPLNPSHGLGLPSQLGNGEKLLFDWPGPRPGPGGFSAEVRVEYRLGDATDTLKREVEMAGYSGFRG
jgi:hypothetical protein